MKIYSYKITRDFGFAPNPYFGICTLATCKPDIRKLANEGDWIIGFGGKNTNAYHKIVYLMEVSEVISFEQYWIDERFVQKRPRFDKNLKYCYGDNIYHKNAQGEWIQEQSHHSNGIEINPNNLKRDTGRTTNVLISTNYWYFGDDAINTPSDFAAFFPECRNYRIFQSEEDIRQFLLLKNHIENNYERGMNGLPFSQKGKFIQYKGE